MIREVALRRALEEARDRRRDELETVRARATTLRRDLRVLVDRLAAIETVHGRFPAQGSPPGPAPPAYVVESAEPEGPAAPAQAPEPARITPMPRHETVHAALLNRLAERHPEGFTVGELRDVLEEAEPDAPHTYDAAWSLTNTLLRGNALELAGTKAGPRGPIRVFRVPDAATPVEAR